MAQIKKLQPGGTAPKSTYGRLIQNGKAIEATDDMLNWLDAQGYYGQQMASAMRSGDDQYIDTDEQGVGWIKNIAIENPELKEKQQTRSTQAARRLEGRRLREARNDIQRLATYDYGKFAPQPKEKSKFISTLNMDINEGKDDKGNITYSFSPQGTNLDILKRVADIEAGLDPETYSDAETINRYYQEWSKKSKNEKGEELPSVWDIFKQELQAGNLSAASDDIAYSIGVISPGRAKELKKASGNKGTQEERDAIVLGKVAEWFKGKGMDADKATEVSANFDIVDVNGKGELKAKKSLTDKFGQNYWFSDRDDGYTNLAGYALINGRLTSTSGQEFKNWLNSNSGKAFIEAYNAGLWSDAAKVMGFNGSDNTWDYYDTRTQYSDYIAPGAKYRDVSGWYLPGEHLGVYDVLSGDDELNQYGLRTIKRAVITKDGKISYDLSGLTKADRVGKSVNPIIHYYGEGPVQLSHDVRWIPLTADNQYWLAIDGTGKKTIYRKRDIWSGYKTVDLGLGDLSNVSVLSIMRAIQGLGRKYQVGGAFLGKTEAPAFIETTSVSDPKKSRDVVKDWGQNWNFADTMEATSLGADLVALVGGEVPVLGEVAGYGADISGFIADVARDGFQGTDLLSLVGGVGLTTAGLLPGAGTAVGVGKILKKLNKASRFLMPTFTLYGLGSAADGLTDIVVNGNLTLENARQVLNGLMAIKSIRKNIAGRKMIEKYGERVDGKTKVDAPEGEDLLKGLSREKQLEIKKKAVDAVVKNNEGLKSVDGNTVEWVDDSGKIIDYEKAWKGLRENGHITDKMLKENRGWFDGVLNTAGKAKNTVSDKTASSWEWFKQKMVPVDISEYKMRSDLSEKDLEFLRTSSGWDWRGDYGSVYDYLHKNFPENWTIPSNKKGGKIKKCGWGEILNYQHTPLKKWELSNGLYKAIPRDESVIPGYIPRTFSSEPSEDEKYWESLNEEHYEGMSDIEEPPISPTGAQKKSAEVLDKPAFDTELKLTWMTPIQAPKLFTQSEAVPQSKGPLDKVLETQRQKFSENLRKILHPEAYAAAQKDLAEVHDRYNARIGGGDNTDSVRGGGDKNSKLSPDYVGLAGGIVEGLITGIANDKVLDKEKEAIRKQSIGAMKSMPTMQPLLKYNLNPLITQYDKQKADLWSRTVETGNATSDQRLRLAGNLATSSQIAKGEDSLLSTISKHITDVDLQNAKLRHQYAEDERQVTDYNHQLGGNTAAAVLRADAQGIKKQSDNLVKQLAEARTDYNNYQNVVSKAKNWDQYMDLYKKWADLPNGAEKEEAYQNLQIFKAMMESGGIRNPYTGVSAADMISRKMKK